MGEPFIKHTTQIDPPLKAYSALTMVVAIAMTTALINTYCRIAIFADVKLPVTKYTHAHNTTRARAHTHTRNIYGVRDYGTHMGILASAPDFVLCAEIILLGSMTEH